MEIYKLDSKTIDIIEGKIMTQKKQSQDKYLEEVAPYLFGKAGLEVKDLLDSSASMIESAEMSVIRAFTEGGLSLKDLKEMVKSARGRHLGAAAAASSQVHGEGIYAPEGSGLCSRGVWTWLQRWLDFIFGWLDLAPEVAGVISKTIKTVVFYSVFLLQRWLDLTPEVAGPGSRGGWTLFLGGWTWLQRGLDLTPRVWSLPPRSRSWRRVSSRMACEPWRLGRSSHTR